MEKTGDKKSRDTVPVTQNGVNINLPVGSFPKLQITVP